MHLDLPGERRTYCADTDLAPKGERRKSILILRDGWALTDKLLAHGDRQIVDLHIPGDVLGLRQLLLHNADFRIMAVTPVTVEWIPLRDLLASIHSDPTLTMRWLQALVLERTKMSERLVSLGRRDATKRTVHFLLELKERLKVARLGEDTRFRCPISQSELADIVGLSTVHLNRVLRKLREDRLLTFQAGDVRFLDNAALAELAEFNPVVPRSRPI